VTPMKPMIKIYQEVSIEIFFGNEVIQKCRWF